MTFQIQSHVCPLQLANTDERRTIHETVVPDGSGILRIGHIEVNEAGVVLGQHYHPLQERFLLAAGSFRLYTLALDDNGEPVHEMRAEDVQAPCVITIPARVVHTFVSTSGHAVLVPMVDWPFSEDMIIKHPLDIPA